MEPTRPLPSPRLLTASGLTATVICPDGLDLPVGTQLRWLVGVAVPADARALGGGLDWAVTGTADDGAVSARR